MRYTQYLSGILSEADFYEMGNDPMSNAAAPMAPQMGGPPPVGGTPPVGDDQGLGDVQSVQKPIQGLGMGNNFLKKLTDELAKLNLTVPASKEILDRIVKALPNLNRDKSVATVKDSFSPPQ
jgi:hypothetical protein